ncbi:MAG TPA: hypothetical protein VI028_04570, partial [Solirubrobacterales bacterium]
MSLLILALTAALVAVAPAVGSSGGPTAVAAKKKKYKRALWKCAPKRYHLSVTDTVGPGSQSAGFARKTGGRRSISPATEGTSA